MAIRERVSLFNRYRDRRIHQVETFKTYYVIMEGTKTEPLYFHHLDRYLTKKRIRNNIRIVYLDRTKRDRGSNTPQQLLDFLNDFRSRKDDDDAVYCMIFDRDSYKGYIEPTAAYLDFIRKTVREPVKLIVTSPCFEIWLLLHKKNSYQKLIVPAKDKIFFNKRLNSSFTYISKMVFNLFGFNPKTTIPAAFVSEVETALTQSSCLTSDLICMATEIGENVSDFIKELCIDPRNL